VRAYNALLGAISYETPQITVQPRKTDEKQGFTAEVSMYNAGDPYQCDDTPCISASGKNICEMIALGQNVCASNYFPFGMMIEVEGLGECEITDRMNSRYSGSNRIVVDWGLGAHQKQEAKDWGRKEVNIYLVK
jgi:3D (Asp-Asp-Asp) domain-containing protein